MGTRALTSILLAALLSALLGAWFVSGGHDVRMRQHEAIEEPRVAAAQRTAEIARELRSDLDALTAREVQRPYFHYQNLIHDPKASAGLNVSPSPLARGGEDPLVLGYFQLDVKGRVTTPTINDELPELSAHEDFVDHLMFRSQVTRDLLPPLKPAYTLPTPSKSAPTQVVKVDPSTYAQNARPNAVYTQQAQTPNVPDKSQTPVTITISPLEWRTLPFNGRPTLVAIRQVQTPDGPLAQGFVIDRTMLSSRLKGKAGNMVAALHPDDTRGTPIAPGWAITVEPNPDTVAQAADAARSVARGFVIRFTVIGSIAAIAAVGVLLLVMRAEALARERSQFAAAAAHELRTPLAGLQLHGDMLADGLGDPGKVRDYARRMSEDASRLGRVVSNILGFSQLERGNLSVNAHSGALGETLCQLAERAQPALDRAGVALDVDIRRDLRARFDADALARIVGNLLDNAEKYARTATDRTVRLAARDRGDVVEVSVEDHGPGVTDKTKLFRPFSRGPSAGDGPAGLGLGLALSMSLARAMGGELAYLPRDGGGATFVLRLPRA